MSFEFWIECSRWFGMTMFRGYLDHPHHAPVHMTGFALLDNDRFCLDFVDPLYTEGVQEFSVEFETIRSTDAFQVCVRSDTPERVYIFVPLTSGWLGRYFPQTAARRLFDNERASIERALLALGRD